MDKRREMVDWQEYYQENAVEQMPWFHRGLDPDVTEALELSGVTPPQYILDLGTGPGTQAIELAKLGYQVSASDLSAPAIEQARARAVEAKAQIEFFTDDILSSQIKGPFDLVIDRGCFHCLQPEQREQYVRVVSELIKDQGYFFLKCFSHLETMEEGPYRFSPAEIEEIFAARFELKSIKETVYQGTLEEFPKALFCVLKLSDTQLGLSVITAIDG